MRIQEHASHAWGSITVMLHWDLHSEDPSPSLSVVHVHRGIHHTTTVTVVNQADGLICGVIKPDVFIRGHTWMCHVLMVTWSVELQIQAMSDVFG